MTYSSPPYPGQMETPLQIENCDPAEIFTFNQSSALWTALCSVLSAVLECKDANGRLLREMFLELPSRELYPSYYSVIQVPICLEMIKDRIKSGYYTNMQMLKKDFDQMVQNAKMYNVRNSQIYKDIIALSREMVLSKGSMFIEMLKSLVSLSGESVSKYLIDPPESEFIRAYYTMNYKPSCFNAISERLSSGYYRSTNELESDVIFILDTSTKGFAPHDPIHDDARTLKNFLQNFFSHRQIQSLPYSGGIDHPGSNVVFQRADYLIHNSQRLVPGDFLYVKGHPAKKCPTIGRINKMWTEHDDSESVSKLETVIFARPDEISGQSRMNLYPNEVFITDKTEVYRSKDIIGKCFVAFLVDQYHTKPPDGANIVDTFLCRFFYDVKTKKLATVVPSEIATLNEQRMKDGVIQNTTAMHMDQSNGIDGTKIERSDDRAVKQDKPQEYVNFSSVKWFNVPPIYVEPAPKPVHSICYLYKLAVEKRKLFYEKYDTPSADK